MQIYSKDESLIITIKKEDSSFSHSFGVRVQSSYEIEKIEAYIPALEAYIDVSHMSEFEAVANELLQSHIESEAA